jgi:hypothetical protein
MSITAAVLAVMTLISHRAHNATVLFANRQNASQIEASIAHTKASDQWTHYQAKRIRETELAAFCEMIPLTMKGSDAQGVELSKRWQAEIERYAAEEKTIQAQAEQYQKTAEIKQEEARFFEKESEKAHHRGDRYDMGELFVEIALVLGSISLLSRQRVFLIFSVVLTLTGACVTASGYLDVHPFYDEASEAKVEAHDSKK